MSDVSAYKQSIGERCVFVGYSGVEPFSLKIKNNVDLSKEKEG